MRDGLTAAGLILTLAGAVVLAARDLGVSRIFRPTTYRDVADGLPRREVKVGFPLIAAGTLLQLLASWW